MTEITGGHDARHACAEVREHDEWQRAEMPIAGGWFGPRCEQSLRRRQRAMCAQHKACGTPRSPHDEQDDEAGIVRLDDPSPAAFAAMERLAERAALLNSMPGEVDTGDAHASCVRAMLDQVRAAASPP